jgi:hypothetical protein
MDRPKDDAINCKKKQRKQRQKKKNVLETASEPVVQGASAACNSEGRVVNTLHCAICLEPFKRPKLLPCFHTFCVTCLQGRRPQALVTTFFFFTTTITTYYLLEVVMVEMIVVKTKEKL